MYVCGHRIVSHRIVSHERFVRKRGGGGMISSRVEEDDQYNRHTRYKDKKDAEGKASKLAMQTVNGKTQDISAS